MAPGVAAAQIVRGTLIEERSGQPIAGAVVSLIDASGKPRARSLTDEAGRFALRSTDPGRYTLRADRIGFSSTTAGIELSAGQTLSYRMAVRPAPVSLATIRVTDEKTCAVRRAGDQHTAVVWEEARKALDATALTQEQRLFSVVLIRYERVLHPRTLRVESERRIEAAGMTENPFVSAPAEKLALGYAQMEGDTTVYYAPDARVLLSDDFLDTHCFWLRKGTGAAVGLLGLAFEPVKGREVSDVAGVLWLDERTSELRHLEYGYTKLPYDIPNQGLGGRVAFKRMPTGAWIVNEWSIRMPRVRANPPQSEVLGAERVPRFRVEAIHETSGEVAAAASEGRRAVEQTYAALSGSVFDSTSGGPLVGAKVFVSGTQYADITNSEGRFTIDRIPGGNYSVAFSHPRLDSLSLPPRSIDLGLEKGQSATLSLAVPSVPTILRLVCGASAVDVDSPDKAPAGLIHGVVRDAKADTVISGARVTLKWTRFRKTSREQLAANTGGLEIMTNTRGVYRACGIPTNGTLVRVHADIDERKSVVSEVRMSKPEIIARDLRITISGSAP